MIVLYVGAGGAIGAIARYVLSSQIALRFQQDFPLGTFTVNILGSLLMGVIIEYLVKTMPHSLELRAFLVVGILGGFTTFSAYSLEAITLIENGSYNIAATYIIGSVLLSIVAVFVGLLCARIVL